MRLQYLNDDIDLIDDNKDFDGIDFNEASHLIFVDGFPMIASAVIMVRSF